eukprot:807437_1
MDGMFGYYEQHTHHHHDHRGAHHHHHHPMKLYCAHCVQSYSLKWPVLENKHINWKNFSYKRELKAFIDSMRSKLGGGFVDEERKESKNKVKIHGKD